MEQSLLAFFKGEKKIESYQAEMLAHLTLISVSNDDDRAIETVFSMNEWMYEEEWPIQVLKEVQTTFSFHFPSAGCFSYRYFA